MKQKLYFYAWAMQAKYGDADEEAPSRFWIVDYVKWKAYDRVRGTAPRDAVRTFILYAEAQLALHKSGMEVLEKEA